MDEGAAASAGAGRGGLLGDSEIGAAAATVVQAWKERLLTTVDLAAAEVRLAAMSGMSMLLFAIVASAALIIAWGLLVALLIYAAMLVGIGWPLAAVLLAVLHVMVAYGSWRATVRLSRNLTLPSLRGAFTAPPIAPHGASAYVPVESPASARRP